MLETRVVRIMKAIVQDRYGPPEVLRLDDVPAPRAGDDQVLVRVHAASVNARDWHLMRGDPYLARLGSPTVGIAGPKTRIRGSDFAGVVEAVGPDVTGFAPGDEVFGDLREADGAFAEYLCAPVHLVARKPANLTFAQAAAVPLAATTALAGLRDVRPGQRVLVNGASGGVGTFAVQIARSRGATVTAVCSTRNADLVASVGAHEVIDYTRADFTRAGRHDVVFDLVGNRSLTALRRAAAPGGRIVLSGGGTAADRPRLVGPMGLILRGAVAGRFGRTRAHVLAAAPSATDLGTLAGMIEAGTVTPVIDRAYPLARVPDAIGYLETDHARAKVVIEVVDQPG